MTHAHTKGQGQRSVGSKWNGNRQTDGGKYIITSCANAVGKYNSTVRHKSQLTMSQFYEGQRRLINVLKVLFKVAQL